MSYRFFEDCALPTATAQQRQFCRNGHSYLPKKAQAAKDFYLDIFSKNRPESPLQGALLVEIGLIFPHVKRTAKKGEIVFKETRPDLDNLAKMILDAATKTGWWLDDAQVSSLKMCKFFGKKPGIHFFAMKIESN